MESEIEDLEKALDEHEAIKIEAREQLREILSHAGTNPKAKYKDEDSTTVIQIADLQFEVQIVTGSEKRIVV